MSNNMPSSAFRKFSTIFLCAIALSMELPVGALTLWGIVCSWVAIPARAQLAGATLSGVVQDEQGGPIPNASVSIKNEANGTARDLKTNTAGLYAAPNLVPGLYAVTVAAQGFSTLETKGISFGGGRSTGA